MSQDIKMKGIKNSYVRNFFAEFLGTFALVVFGDGAIAQVVLGKSVTDSDFFGGFLNICFGYGLALMIGILISGGVSGGHLNPAVSLAMVCVKKLKITQLPVYMAAQFLGAFVAALVLWGNYADAIRIHENNLSGSEFVSDYSGATMGVFSSFPNNQMTSLTTLVMDQILGTALLVIIILAATDSKNMKLASGLVPLTIGLGLTAIHISFGLNAGSAVNPARDFSPRLLTAMAGWGELPFTAYDYWFWVPLVMPFIGGPIGAAIYTLLIEVHHQQEF